MIEFVDDVSVTRTVLFPAPGHPVDCLSVGEPSDGGGRALYHVQTTQDHH